VDRCLEVVCHGMVWHIARLGTSEIHLRKFPVKLRLIPVLLRRHDEGGDRHFQQIVVRSEIDRQKLDPIGIRNWSLLSFPVCAVCVFVG